MSTSSLSITGIKLSYLHYFIKEVCGGEDKISQYTVQDICQKYIIPITKKSETSYVYYLHLNNGEDSKDYIGEDELPLWYISYSWKDKFLNVVHAITSFLIKEYGPEADNIIVWIDIFCYNQHQHYTEFKPAEWWNNSIPKLISTINNILLIVDTYTNPLAFQRTWCIYELYNAYLSKTRFEISMPSSEFVLLHKAMYNSKFDFYQQITKINSHQSETTNQHDKANIFSSFYTTATDLIEIDKNVFNLIENWLSSQIEIELRKQLTDLGPDDLTVLTLKNNLGIFYLNMCNYDYAENTFLQCVSARQNLLGANHLDTLISIYYLGLVYYHQNKYKQAEGVLSSCLTTMSHAIGQSHAYTLQTSSVLGSLYIAIERFDKAKSIFSKYIEPDTSLPEANTIFVAKFEYELACLNTTQGQLTEAVKIYNNCLKKYGRLYGENDMRTIDVLTRLGVTYERDEMYEMASKTYMKAIDRMSRVVGNEHPDTMKLQRLLHGLKDKKKISRGRRSESRGTSHVASDSAAGGRGGRGGGGGGGGSCCVVA